MVQQEKQTVLIFDSGVGGLSVYQEIRDLLPQLNYIYIFDNEAYPYGELSQDVLIRRVHNGITRFVAQHPVDIVVIACNTASTIVLPSLRAQLTVPVVGVVPAIKPASSLANKAVGLIATPATVTREYTRDLIRNFSNNKTVELLGSTRLVDMAEEKLRGQPVDLQELAEILTPLKSHVDVAVLGCTHFPLLRQEIEQVLGQEVMLVDSGKAIARRVKELLRLESGQADHRTHQIFSSALPWQESALNITLHELGFTPVQRFPILDV
ncbi:glutamate racemase [Vibrio proteolyticus]|uniref:Glutamate racemase n=1 Tax=Vibrio proteolyticus NBRC 13287 TaxID=1219065 RepID=U2ZN86_VIBPR|nr:glutamate racemase [Vibrio proteolyticus NBRC 13287]